MTVSNASIHYSPPTSSPSQNKNDINAEKEPQAERPDKKSEEEKSPLGLTADEQRQVTELQARDSEVRAHEAAHLAAGGGVVGGGANFSYQQGPDGRMYAVGGEVPISTPAADSPREAIAVAQKLKAAAMAPANPSPQDYKVAATASMMEAKARQELAAQQREEQLATYADNQNRFSKTSDE